MHCPSFYIFLAYFVDDLYEGLVCHLCLPISLRVIGRWTMVLNLVEFQHLPYFTIDKSCAIVTDNLVRYPKPDNYVFFDEVCYFSSRDFMEWHCLCPFGEVFCSHQDSYVSMRWRVNWSYQIKPLSVEGLWGDHAV